MIQYYLEIMPLKCKNTNNSLKVASDPAHQNSVIRKNSTMPFLKYKHLKLKLRVI